MPSDFVDQLDFLPHQKYNTEEEHSLLKTCETEEDERINDEFDKVSLQ